jgi:hypothetical protein
LDVTGDGDCFLRAALLAITLSEDGGWYGSKVPITKTKEKLSARITALREQLARYPLHPVLLSHSLQDIKMLAEKSEPPSNDLLKKAASHISPCDYDAWRYVVQQRRRGYAERVLFGYERTDAVIPAGV